MKDWLRLEWERTGMPFSKTNEACHVVNAATRKYFTKCHLWYMPPADMFEKSLRYKNKRENGNLIARNWQSCEKKMVLTVEIFFLRFLGYFWYKKLQKSATNSYIYILLIKKLKSRHPIALKRSH